MTDMIQPPSATATATATATPTATATASAPSVKVQRLASVSILVVDDCLDTGFLVKTLLTRGGANVTLAGDGQEALNLTGQKAFDVILMDIQMPFMDGYSAMRRLKEMGSVVPVIAITACTKAEDVEKIVRAGFFERISKPVDKELLFAAIGKCL